MPSETRGHDPRIKASVSRHWPILWVEGTVGTDLISLDVVPQVPRGGTVQHV